MGAVFSLHQEYERLSTDAQIGIEHKVVEGKNNDEESEYDPLLATSNLANNQETSCLVDVLNTPTNGVLCRYVYYHTLQAFIQMGAYCTIFFGFAS